MAFSTEIEHKHEPNQLVQREKAHAAWQQHYTLGYSTTRSSLNETEEPVAVGPYREFGAAMT